MEYEKTKLVLEDPVLISQAPEEIRNWGPWQFPTVFRTEDDNIQVSYHIEADSAKAYGKSKEHAVSEDGGKTWTRMQDIDEPGLLLGNGDRIKPFIRTSLEISDVKLPEEPIAVCNIYAIDFFIYKAEDVDSDISSFYFLRKKSGQENWSSEKSSISIPGQIVRQCEGVIPRSFVWRIRVSPGGDLWAMNYSWRIMNGVFEDKCRAMFFVSSDYGHSWRYSEIPYQPIPSIDEKYHLRMGFTEPDVAFLPDGSIICLLRTTDGNGIGPTYRSRSVDGGISWSKPVYFDKLGVWPELLTLNNGITLASYGRMGLFLRATADPSGSVWDSPLELVKPAAYQTETCSYSALISLDDNTALVIYSDFNYPDAKGIPRKSILSRKITADILKSSEQDVQNPNI
jgi:hypothetical protein